MPDACDNCPGVANEAQQNRDGDHTGDACDPCPLTPQYGVQPDGDGDGVADSCDDCPGTANPPRACSSDADCGGGDNFCIVASGSGRCARQLDDVDGDGVGDACDSCVALANGETQGNANVHSEADRSVATLGDPCDPVPVVSTRQRYQHAGNADEATLEKMAGQILLSGRAAIGSADEAPASFSGTVGFRFCACRVLDAKSKLRVLDAKTCLATRCRIDPAAFEDDPEGRWCKITTDGGFDERRAVSFDGSTHCSTDADLVTKAGPTERCVVGEPLSILWDVAADEKSSCVGDGGPPGIVWSHVLVGDAGFASERDRVTDGALRDSYSYVVKAPVVPWVDFAGPQSKRCFQCEPKLRWDWKSLFVSDPSDWGKLDRLARIRVSGERVLAVVGATQAMDVTALVTPEVRELLGAELTWLTPVEASTRARDGIGRTVATPRRWSGPSARVLEVSMSSDGLSLVADSQRVQPEVAPSEREGARALFSASERAVYLVGGTADAANEIWRHSLDERAWSLLAPGHGPALAEVRSVAYDPARKQLFVLDAKGLLGIDVDTGTRTMMLEGASASPDASVVALGDGELVMVEPAGASEWLARWIHPREDGGAEVLGVVRGRGQLVDEPVAIDRNVALAVLDGDREQLVELERSAFQPEASPPKAPDEDAPGSDEEAEPKSWCSCRSHPGTSGWLWLLAAIGPWAMRRRRARRA